VVVVVAVVVNRHQHLKHHFIQREEDGERKYRRRRGRIEKTKTWSSFNSPPSYLSYPVVLHPIGLIIEVEGC